MCSKGKLWGFTFAYKKGRYLKTVHKGRFSKVGLAHAALLDYADKNNIKLRKTAYVYFCEKFDII